MYLCFNITLPKCLHTNISMIYMQCIFLNISLDAYAVEGRIRKRLYGKYFELDNIIHDLSYAMKTN